MFFSSEKNAAKILKIRWTPHPFPETWVSDSSCWILGAKPK
jgi:hypothetical protein